MLVGKIGGGKSSLGNFLLQKEVFYASDVLAAVTQDNQCESKMMTDKIKLRVIDTQVFGDFREPEKVKQDLANAFCEAKDGVDAFILVISSVERIEREMVINFNMFENFMDHEHFYDYVIPVFTKADQRLRNRGEKDIYSYEKQERVVYLDIKKEGMRSFKDKAAGKWMCVCSTNTKDQFYHDMIIRRLLSTIDSIRLHTGGMVCTANIMRRIKDIKERKDIHYKDVEEDEILLKISPLLIGHNFMEIFTNGLEEYKKQHRKPKEIAEINPQIIEETNLCLKKTSKEEFAISRSIKSNESTIDIILKYLSVYGKSDDEVS